MKDEEKEPNPCFKIAIYLVILGLIYSAIEIALFSCGLDRIYTAAACAGVGGLGGVTYCLRAIYLNYCVQNQWDKRWEIWYYIRPIVSMWAGSVSFIFVNLILFILGSKLSADSTLFGPYAIAYMAGLNVDNYIKKLEEIWEWIFRIPRSGAAKLSYKPNEPKDPKEPAEPKNITLDKD